MLKIKDFKIISGLEGNATDGWYVYSNASEYTFTIQVDVETDIANAEELVRISSFGLGWYLGTITQQSQSVSSTQDGVQIIASYLIDRSEVISSGYILDRYYAYITEMSVYVTDSTNTDVINKELYIFVPYSIISFCCIDMKNYPVEYINNKVTKCFTGTNVYTELSLLFDPASNYSIEDCKYKLYDCYDLQAERDYDEITNQIIGPIIYQKKIRNGHYIIGAMIYNINGTLYNYERNDVNFGCIASALNDFSDLGYTDNNTMITECLDYAHSDLNDQIDEPTIYFSTNNTVSIVGPSKVIFSPTSLTSNTDTLHVWGDIIANNITDATSRLTAAQATLTTLNDMFTIETVVTGTYTTKAANTLEDTGITFGDLEQGAIYAIYGSNTNGRVADLRIRAKNGSGTDINFYEYCLNSSTRMNLALPVFYCRTNKGSTYGDYHLWVSRTATGSNTYTIYKILGPLL